MCWLIAGSVHSYYIMNLCSLNCKQNTLYVVHAPVIIKAALNICNFQAERQLKLLPWFFRAISVEYHPLPPNKNWGKLYNTSALCHFYCKRLSMRCALNTAHWNI